MLADHDCAAYAAAMPDPMPARPPRYSDAVAFLLGRERVRLAELATALGSGAEVADVFLSCLLAEGRIGPRGLDGWWPVRPATAPEAAAAADAALDGLEAAAARLQRAVAAAGDRAAATLARAMAAERRLAALERQESAAPGAAVRLAAVKRLLARELHPDQPGSMAERGLREALFKRLWPMLEATERSAG